MGIDVYPCLLKTYDAWNCTNKVTETIKVVKANK